MKYVRRRQINKLNIEAEDLTERNCTIKQRCSYYKTKSLLDVMYAHPYNKRGIDRIYIVKGGTAIMKRVRPAHWPDNNPLRATIKLGPIIHSVSVEIDSIPVEIKL